MEDGSMQGRLEVGGGGGVQGKGGGGNHTDLYKNL